jgi:hypothetical protein
VQRTRHPLATQRAKVLINASRVAARSIEVGHHAEFDRIGAYHEHDRDGYPLNVRITLDSGRRADIRELLLSANCRHADTAALPFISLAQM